ncbi:MAG: DVUA0089 family protein [Acidobacteriota bacterium]|nr:DVUA0089 family protein [Acidobacteriota bacterium]
MRINTNKLAYALGALLLGYFGTGRVQALSLTYTGMFLADSQVNPYSFSIPTRQTLDFFTTSYAGGRNLDGTISQKGGFVPSLTLFSVNTGSVVECGAAGLTCSGTAMGPTNVDPITKTADDVNFTVTLNAGSYLLDLAEFPNVAIGGINDGFLTSVDSTLFSDACGAGTFLEADTAPCAQRNGNFALNVGSVPEPATFWLALPIVAFGVISRKRSFARS